jgi:peptide/nickel transport system permease protein
MAGSTLASPIADAPPAGLERDERAVAGVETWRRFRRHRLAVASTAVLAFMLLAVTFGPLLWPVPINDIDFSAHLDGPSWDHLLGTDDLGQDLLARMLYGGRISLGVGLAAMLVAIIVGTVIGAIAGMSRGVVDMALMWLTDLFLSLPQLPLLLLIIYLFREPLKQLVGPELGVFILIVAVIGGFRWMPVARLVRAQFLSLREKRVRRGGPRTRHDRPTSRDTAHPAELAGACHCRRHDRRRRRDHRRVDPVPSRPRFPARHPDLGAHPL